MNARLVEQVFDLGPVACLVFDRGGAIRLANQKAAEFFGYGRAELLGASIGLLFSDREADAILERQAAVHPDDPDRLHNCRAAKKGDGHLQVDVVLRELRVDGEEFVLCSVREGGDAPQVDQRFRSVVESAPNGIIMIDEQGRIVLVNKATEQMFGYAREDLVGEPIECLVPEAIRAEHVSLMGNFMKHPCTRGMGVGRELFGRRKDGRPFPVEIGLCPIEQEERLFVVGAIVDISERHEAENALREKHEELEEFAYRTSHDLRAPLLSINGLVDCIVEDVQLGELEEVQVNTSRIKSLATKLVALVEDMLALSEADQGELCNNPFDFISYLDVAREKFAFLIEQKGVAVQASLQHQDELFGDTTRIVQILDNLISNGIKYAQSSRSDRFVELGTRNDASTFYITVRDNGCGIAPEYQEKIFEMFHRLHKNSESGSGLGLYIVRKHLAKMDAEISLDSSEEGSLFTVSFPRASRAKH